MKRQSGMRAVRRDDLRRWRVYLLCVLVVAVEVLFDTSVDDTFSLVKYTVLMFGVLTLAVLWVATWVRDERLPLLRNGLHWPVVGLVVWAAVTTATSINPRASVLGFRGSYDGLFLTLALAVLFFIAVETVTVTHLRMVVSVFYVGAGGTVVFYGLVQLHDRLTSWGGTWDTINWGSASFRNSSIWSTLGNPNHLGGLLAVMFPIGVALFIVHRGWVRRTVIAAIAVAAVPELLYTTSRGAWMAALAGLVVVAALLFRDLRASPVVLGGGAVVLVVSVLLGATLLGGARDLGKQFGTIFDPQGRTTVERTELWGAAWRMASDRPVVGFGPDTYRVPFNRYQSRRYVDDFGATNVANGSHDIFFTYLAQQGFVGLALLLGLLAFAALRAVGAWRRLAGLAAERRPEVRRGAIETRYLFAGLLAATVAFLVEASFNTQQLALTLCLWLLLALVTAVTLDVGVPVSWRPRLLVAAGAGERVGAVAPAEVRRLGGAGSRARPDYGRTIAVSTAVGVVALAGAWLMSGPYRADALFFEAEGAGNKALSLAEQGAADQARSEGANALKLMDRAMATNPWEARYPAEAGNLQVELGRFELSAGQADPATVRRAVGHFEAGRRLLRKAARLQPGHAPFLVVYAQVLDRIRANAPEGTIDVTGEVVAAYRRAISANPWDANLPVALAGVLTDEGKGGEARAVLRAGLARRPADVGLLVAAAQLDDRQGRRTQALVLWKRVLELTPDHPLARQAVRRDQGA